MQFVYLFDILNIDWVSPFRVFLCSLQNSIIFCEIEGDQSTTCGQRMTFWRLKVILWKVKSCFRERLLFLLRWQNSNNIPKTEVQKSTVAKNPSVNSKAIMIFAVSSFASKIYVLPIINHVILDNKTKISKSHLTCFLFWWLTLLLALLQCLALKLSTVLANLSCSASV